MSEKTCEDCKYCILTDYGYSRWAAEGTDADCLLGLNPELPSDRWYGEAKELKYASKCGQFSAGDPVAVDVDQEDGPLQSYSDDYEIIELLAERQSN